MSGRRPIVGGNWKMNTDLAAAVELAEDIAASSARIAETCDLVVFPPFPYLQAVGKALGHHGVWLGGQDVYFEANGAFTGEVSTAMLADLHASVVLIGHSERRHIIGESDELIAHKLRAAIDDDLTAILCVGETTMQRAAGETESVLDRQLESALEEVVAEDARRLVIAYEPVWAIGTGQTATPEDAETAHAFIRGRLQETLSSPAAASIRIQYGGSVKPANAAGLITQPNIDGFLVGGASLRADDYLAIAQAVVDAHSRTSEARNACQPGS